MARCSIAGGTAKPVWMACRSHCLAPSSMPARRPACTACSWMPHCWAGRTASTTRTCIGSRVAAPHTSRCLPCWSGASQEQHAEARCFLRADDGAAGPARRRAGAAAVPAHVHLGEPGRLRLCAGVAGADGGLCCPGTSVEGTEVSFPAMVVYAAGGVEVPASVDVSMLPMAVNASQDEHNEAVIAFPALLVASEGETLELPAFRVTLPAFGGASYYADIEAIGLGSDAISDASYILVEERIAAADAAAPSVSDEVIVSDAGFGADFLAHGLQVLMEETGARRPTRLPPVIHGCSWRTGRSASTPPRWRCAPPWCWRSRRRERIPRCCPSRRLPEGVGAGDEEAYAARANHGFGGCGAGRGCR